MVYTAQFMLEDDLIDRGTNNLFAPGIAAYQIHSVALTYNGVSHDERQFVIDHPWVRLNGPYFHTNDKLSLQVEYFYKSENRRLFEFLTNAPAGDARTEIMSQHYIDGLFALDNGLYKEAVLNFGTVVEALLNDTLASGRDLNSMIKAEKNADSSMRAAMHNIRDLRNSCASGETRVRHRRHAREGDRRKARAASDPSLLSREDDRILNDLLMEQVASEGSCDG